MIVLEVHASLYLQHCLEGSFFRDTQRKILNNEKGSWSRFLANVCVVECNIHYQNCGSEGEQ